MRVLASLLYHELLHCCDRVDSRSASEIQEGLPVSARQLELRQNMSERRFNVVLSIFRNEAIISPARVTLVASSALSIVPSVSTNGSTMARTIESSKSKSRDEDFVR